MYSHRPTLQRVRCSDGITRLINESHFYEDGTVNAEAARLPFGVTAPVFDIDRVDEVVSSLPTSTTQSRTTALHAAPRRKVRFLTTVYPTKRMRESVAESIATLQGHPTSPGTFTSYTPVTGPPDKVEEEDSFPTGHVLSHTYRPKFHLSSRSKNRFSY
jgi:hypothetical protein